VITLKSRYQFKNEPIISRFKIYILHLVRKVMMSAKINTICSSYVRMALKDYVLLD